MRKVIESSTGQEFNLRHLKRIFNVSPESFVHRWEMNYQTKKYDLVIDVPSNIENRLFCKDVIEIEDFINLIQDDTPLTTKLTEDLYKIRKMKF